MKISIVTAVYNSELTIGFSIASIKSQNYSNLESIVVDGASTDNTMKIIESIIDERRIVISERDFGIYDALNKGISASTGEVIGILHSDDYYADNDVLGKIAIEFSDPNVDVVYGDLDYVLSRDTSVILRHWVAGDYQKNKINRGWMPPHPTIFVRRQVFESTGLYDKSYQISADYDWVLKIFKNNRLRTKYIPQVLVKMRTGGESNKSIKNISRKLFEDYQIIRSAKIGGVLTLILKNARKLPQFFYGYITSNVYYKRD